MSEINDKSCIDKLVEHFNPILSLKFEFPVSEAEEEEDEEVPNEISRLLGHLSRQNRKKNIMKSVQKRAFTYKDWHEMLSSCLKRTLQQGQPPLHPSEYNMEVVEVPSIGV